MKRKISFLIAIIMLLSACSRSPVSVPETNTENEQAVTEKIDKTEQADDNTQQSSGALSQSANTQKTGQSDTVSENNTQTTADDPDSEDVSDGSPVSSVDTNTAEKDPNITYQEDVGTGITEMVITEEFYDEQKLELPKLYINTFDGSDITSKTEYTNATIEITNTTPPYQKAKTAVEVRGRGNSTWTRFEKKPYKLKFAMKTDMFGMGKAKKWVLLANSMDDTMLRSALAFDLGKTMGLEFTSEYRYVNVFVNGEYEGVYILCEQQEEGETRVNIDSSKSGEVDTGYFLESLGENISSKPYFTLPKVNGEYLGDVAYETHRVYIHSPTERTLTDDQKTYIQDYITQVNEAIFNHNWARITQLCDIDSFVNMFIVDEVFLNNDCGYSFYMYKKAGGKLQLGPLWDFDQSAGDSAHGTATYKGWYAGSDHKWYSELIQMPEFEALVRARYTEKKADIYKMIESIDTIVEENKYDFAMSNYVHNNFGNKNRWRTIPEIYSLKSYSQHVAYLKTWLTNRLTWMEDQLSVQ